MINLQGEVIGINTLVAGQAEPGVTPRASASYRRRTAKPCLTSSPTRGSLRSTYMRHRICPDDAVTGTV